MLLFTFCSHIEYSTYQSKIQQEGGKTLKFFDGLYTYKTVAERYGVSETTVRLWVKRGWLKARKLGGRIYFTPEDMNNFERRDLNA